MMFQGIQQVPVNSLGLSQLYISQEKYASVMEWFCPEDMDRFQPLSVHDFGNGVNTLTDGHTRALAAYKNGILKVPVVYDNDKIVTNPTGQMLYKADIEWCSRFGLKHIGQLERRIISKDLYARLWIERCNRSYNLITRTSESARRSLQKLAPKLFLYGSSEDLTELYFENASGDLFLYRENCLILERGEEFP